MNDCTDGKLLAVIDEWRGILLSLDEDAVRLKPSKDRWSICEVIGHLVDLACNNHQRFVRAQERDELTFPQYDQNAWVIAGDYNQSDWPSLVGLWYSYNQHIAQIIRRIPTSQFNTPCTITPYETCTLAFLIDDYLIHLQHHMGKIKERIDAQTYQQMRQNIYMAALVNSGTGSF